MSNPVYAVVGSGAVGCYIGAHLISAGAKVILIGRPRMGQLVKDGGIEVRRLDGGKLYLSPSFIAWSDDIQDVAQADVILLTVKSQDTESTAKEIKNILKPSAKIISFQNGVRNVGILNLILPEFTVYGGMIPYNIVQEEGKAAFSQATAGELYVDESLEENLPDLALKAEKSGLALNFEPNFREIMWGKLILNLSNSLNALCGLSLTEQLLNPLHRKILASSMEEALRVLKHAGIRARNFGALPIFVLPWVLRLPNFIFSKIAANQVNASEVAKLSMSQDLELRRKTEVDFLNGEIVGLAIQHADRSALHEKIVELIHAAEIQGQGSPKFSAEELARLLMIS